MKLNFGDHVVLMTIKHFTNTVLSFNGLHYPPAYKSDHAPVTCFFRNPDSPKGPGLWRFNNNLLLEPLYPRKIRECIEQTVAQNAESTPDVLWEVIKGRIQLATMDFKKEQRLHQKQKIEALELYILKNHVRLNDAAVVLQ